MNIYSFEGRIPRIDVTSYVSPSASIIGKVTVGKNVWIGPGAVLRGDYGEIEIGDYTAVEDNCVIHARPGEKTVIGKHVTLGHLSLVHTGTVGDWAVVGMGSVISDFARIGEWAAIAEGAVVKNRSEIPERKIAAGVPAKVVGDINQDYIELWTKYKENYNSFANRYKENLKPLEAKQYII
ncbi:gamma carbonic anhydrase family protein [Oxyplasma meridianum]|uniref:Gamma carbonic anhydrase family protein n=1 Tax=Oxyplasma meridianum TaxID=3073602 RepID=A0AAX4NE96_9ARCH